jgi:hypothetical protein
LVVVTSWPDAVPDVLDKALKSLKQHNYTVLLGSQLVQAGEELTREESALVGSCRAAAGSLWPQ